MKGRGQREIPEKTHGPVASGREIVEALRAAHEVSSASIEVKSGGVRAVTKCSSVGNWSVLREPAFQRRGSPSLVEGPGFDSRSDHPEFGLPWFSEITPGECWDGLITNVMADSFPSRIPPPPRAPPLMTSLSTRPSNARVSCSEDASVRSSGVSNGSGSADHDRMATATSALLSPRAVTPLDLHLGGPRFKSKFGHPHFGFPRLRSKRHGMKRDVNNPQPFQDYSFVKMVAGEDDLSDLKSVLKNKLVAVQQWAKNNLLFVLTMAGVVVGVALGLLLRSPQLGSTTVLLMAYPGELFMRLLKLMILPLIIASLIAVVESVTFCKSGKVVNPALIASQDLDSVRFFLSKLRRCCGGAASSALVSHPDELGSIPDGVAPGFSPAGIVPGDAAGWRALSGIYRIPPPPHIPTPPPAHVALVLQAPTHKRISSSRLNAELHGRIAARAVAYFLLTSLANAGLGVALALNLRPGVAVDSSGVAAPDKTAPDAASPRDMHILDGFLDMGRQVSPTHHATDPVSLLASHQGDPGSIPGRGHSRIFCMWESCWTMPLVGGFFSGVSRLPRPFIPALLHTAQSPSSALKTSPLFTINYALLKALLKAFEAERRKTDKDDTASCIKHAIATKRKALNWRAVFSSHYVYVWDFLSQ
ncbi:hypothetical protein PR048_001309 [Dryococelus australis]|uniref:Amino acid transporter n=1 Tax=Dryococelus australis TaxID=614101 RepID=A0ABQ9IH04_9NEOP|nr:hypothetical protein PR048_001309 [Dryococelus australis]